MKIVFATPEYIERGKPTTGFPNYLYRVTRALCEMGHEPVIVTVGKRNGHRIEAGVEIFSIRVTAIDYGNSVITRTIHNLKISYAINRKIEEIMQQTKVDIIQFPSLGGMSIFYKGSVPAIMRLSSYAKTYFGTYNTYTKYEVDAMAIMERMAARRCKAVFAPCQNTATAFGKDCRRKVGVIETPFVNDVNDGDDRYVREYLGEKKYVLFFGTLYAEKGILVIADILRDFLEQNKDYYFVFVGDSTKIKGRDAKEILYHAAGEHKDRVIIFSALPHRQLYPVIANSDFVVLPSLMDNLPNACIEAMNFSKIVVGTDGASFEQLIQDGENGFLCKIGDSEDLLRKMQMAADLENGIKCDIEKKAHERIEKLHPKYAVKRLLKFYQYVIEKSNVL